MAIKDPNDWNLEDAQEAVAAEPWVAVNRAFYDGDHWQDADGWIGPEGAAGEDGADVALAALEEAFCSRNVIAEVAERHASGVIGRAPHRSWQDREGRPADETLPADVQNAIAEATQLLDDWRRLVSLDDAMWDAVVSLLLGESAAAYLYVPQGLLVAGADGVPAIPSGAAAEQLRRIRVRFPSPSQCRVITDPDTLSQVGVYVYQVAEKTRADLTYLDDDQKTVLRTIGEDVTGAAAEPVLRDLGGRLLMYEMRRPLFITEQVRQGQRALNLALSMIPRNVVTGGFLERVLLNAQLPGKFEVQSDGQRRFVPDPFKVGAGTLNLFQGSEQYDAKGAFQGYATPSMQYRDPVPIDASEGAVRAHERAILAEVDQRHMLLSDSADASGYSRALARAEFVASMMRTGKAANGMLEWLQETPLALAEAFAGGANGRPVLLGRVEASATVRLDAGPVSPDEARVIKEMRADGLISDETARVMLGIEEPGEEAERLKAQRIAHGSAEEAAVIKAYVDAGFSLFAALLRVGHDEETAKKLSRGDVVDGVTQ